MNNNIEQLVQQIQQREQDLNLRELQLNQYQEQLQQQVQQFNIEKANFYQERQQFNISQQAISNHSQQQNEVIEALKISLTYQQPVPATSHLFDQSHSFDYFNQSLQTNQPLLQYTQLSQNQHTPQPFSQ
ncbi:hypothetical protein SS50377_27709 [Spironucleus salmonicida]|uniref:Uncharacterized protein n=1 Tax=Spironucleus salmonicida TaxID=348837 RepID=V6LPI3_9EUKA|nr:hypothetical protein SS50377_27709 [Spironucleus salmonicida]|eukprot:EST46515.1 Hypothetical protein SS50377_fx083 [Spironucleus salmonicida]